MSDCITTSHLLTYAAKLITASAVLNIICWIALMWSAIAFRRFVKQWKASVRID